MKNIKVFDVERKNIQTSVASFSNDGKFIAIGFVDGYIGVWNVDLKCEEYNLIDLFININHIYFKDQKSMITDVCNKNEIRETYIWNILDKNIEFSINDYHYISINEKYIVIDIIAY